MDNKVKIICKKNFPPLNVSLCVCLSKCFVKVLIFYIFRFQKEFDRSAKSHSIFPDTRFPPFNVLAIHLVVIIIYPHFSTRNYYLFVNRILFWHSKQRQSDFFLLIFHIYKESYCSGTTIVFDVENEYIRYFRNRLFFICWTLKQEYFNNILKLNINKLRWWKYLKPINSQQCVVLYSNLYYGIWIIKSLNCNL